MLVIRKEHDNFQTYLVEFKVKVFNKSFAKSFKFKFKLRNLKVL